MDKDRMDDLARDPRFIPGIYNYCDRWCERCAFTSRCMNYAMGEEEKLAIIGIERSMAAWATLLRRFPDHEDAIFSLGTLKRLLRQVETAFPNARAFQHPGFDTIA